MKLGVRARLVALSAGVIALAVVLSFSYLDAVLDPDWLPPDTAGLLRRMIVMAALLALLTSIVLANLAALWLSRSVHALTEAAGRMAAGDLSERSRVAGQDDIAELGRALDKLAGSLQGALADLRAERDRMSRVLDGMREGVLLLDREGRVALSNPALRGMLLVGDDLHGKTPLEVVRNAELKKILDRALGSDEPVSGELEVGDLKPRLLLAHAVRLPDVAGGLLVVFVDVTDLRRLESLRRDFVANVSHELRTPITSVRSAAETLSNMPGLSPAAAGEFAEVIERNAERLAGIVDDLLDLSRIESREFKLNLAPIELGPLVQHIVSLFAPRMAQKKLQVVVEIPPATPAALIDRKAFEHVLSNLIDNAAKYGPVGGAIVVRATPENGRIRVAVRDSGPGIEARHLPRLFERFYRVDAGRARDVGGTGLGLSIVKHLVDAMGGTVGVDSTPGQGSTFSFTIKQV